MGKFILCSGTRAKEPLRIEMTDTVLYTIEELCYYIYQHIYLITEEFFNESIFSWLETCVHHKELAEKLRKLNRNGGTVKDMVISVLCSTDYYSEKEMKDLLVVMNKMEGLPLIKRRKIKADIYVSYGRYLFAAQEYEAILNSKDASILTTEEYGNLLHNYAIVLLYLGSVKEAVHKFKEAYQSNQNEETLRQYLTVLCMLRDETLLKNELEDMEVPSGLLEQIQDVVAAANAMESDNSYHHVYQKLSGLKEHSDVPRFFQETERVIEKWIDEYRNKVS